MQNYIKDIRATYTKDFVSKDITKRQIAVATYLIDKLALRAGNEKVYCFWIYFILFYISPNVLLLMNKFLTFAKNSCKMI